MFEVKFNGIVRLVLMQGGPKIGKVKFTVN